MVTIKEAKRYLLQVKKAVEILKQCDSDFTELNSRSMGLVAKYGDSTGHKTTVSDTSSFISRKQELEKEVEERYEIWLKKRIEIRRFILNLEIPSEKEHLRTLLVLRYVTLKSFEEISCSMGYSYVYVVKRLHPEALRYAAENMK